MRYSEASQSCSGAFGLPELRGAGTKRLVDFNTSSQTVCDVWALARAGLLTQSSTHLRCPDEAPAGARERQGQYLQHLLSQGPPCEPRCCTLWVGAAGVCAGRGRAPAAGPER